MVRSIRESWREIEEPVSARRRLSSGKRCRKGRHGRSPFCVWTLEKKKWTLKKSDQLPPYSFFCLRVQSTVHRNDGKRGWGGKKRIGLPNIHVADVMGSAIARSYFCAQRIPLVLLQCKGSPAPVYLFVVLGRGGHASPVQYKFQSMHPGECNYVNSLFPVFNIHVK